MTNAAISAFQRSFRCLKSMIVYVPDMKTSKTNVDEMKPKSWRAGLKEQCAQCLRGPKQIIRSIVLLTCTIVVIFQISECLRKIKNPPTTTYTHFDFNESIKYPAVTFCRDPPYKYDVLQRHHLLAHPRITSEWKYFPFNETDLDAFWDEATYTDADNFISYGLLGSKEKVHLENSIHFQYGKCQTIYPKIEMTLVGKQFGYSIRLKHSISDILNTTSTIPPGYHIYIHQSTEPFLEDSNATPMDYIYVNVGEEVDVKLAVQQANMLIGGPKSCEGDQSYSEVSCVRKCRENEIYKDVKCSGPWLKQKNLPRCTNYTNMRELIVKYVRVSTNVSLVCPCLSRCRSIIYSSNVVDRNFITEWDPNTITWNFKNIKDRQDTQVSIYFNTKTVSVYEETHGYDWSLFLADFGGSLGFLLGLSVLGVIRLLENVFNCIFQPLAPKVDQRSDENVDDCKDRRISNIGRHEGDGDSVIESVGSTDKTVGKDKESILRNYDACNDKQFYI